MKQVLISLIFSLFSFSAWSQDLQCEISYNNQVILKNKVYVTDKNQKLIIGKSAIATAYLTVSEKNLYTIEAFLPEYEVRIYGQGGLNDESETVTASLWGRESMVDVTCRVAK